MGLDRKMTIIERSWFLNKPQKVMLTNKVKQNKTKHDYSFVIFSFLHTSVDVYIPTSCPTVAALVLNQDNRENGMFGSGN